MYFSVSMTEAKYLSGFLTGAASTLIFHPFDALRIRLFYDTKEIGGIRSLYNGLKFNVATSCMKNMLTYPTHDYILERLQNNYTPYWADIYSSFLTGLLLSSASTPINVIKIPLQASGDKQRAIDIGRDIYRRYGVTGFYRGGLATFCRDVLWNTIYFPLFRFVNERVTNNKTASSVFSGMVTMTITYPFDGIRLYRQNNKNNYNFWYGFMYSFNRSRENIRSYGVSLVRIPLATTFSHMLYLYLSEKLSKK
jgi:hypothetical protein